MVHISGFDGILQVDGYEAYKALARQGQVQLAFCSDTIRTQCHIDCYTSSGSGASLKSFNRACNASRERVLSGLSPDKAVRQRMKAKPKLARTHYELPSAPCILPKALLVVAAAREVSHPNR